MLGVTVEPYDRDGRQRAVDAILHYANGRKAALEVSATGPDNEVPIQHYLGQRGHSRTIAGVAGTWVVQLPRTFHPADMRLAEEGLRRCEEREVMHLSELAAVGADHGQLTRQGVRADLIEATGARVHFVLLPDGRIRRPGPGRASSRAGRLARHGEDPVQAGEAGHVRPGRAPPVPDSPTWHLHAPCVRYPRLQRPGAGCRSPAAWRVEPGVAPDRSTCGRGRPGDLRRRMAAGRSVRRDRYQRPEVNVARKTGSKEQAVALWRTLQISLSAPWGKPLAHQVDPPSCSASRLHSPRTLSWRPRSSPAVPGTWAWACACSTWPNFTAEGLSSPCSTSCSGRRRRHLQCRSR